MLHFRVSKSIEYRLAIATTEHMNAFPHACRKGFAVFADAAKRLRHRVLNHTAKESHAATRQNQADSVQRHQAHAQRRAETSDSQRHRVGHHGRHRGTAAFHRVGYRFGRRARAGSLHRHRGRLRHCTVRRKPRERIGPHCRLRRHRGRHRGNRRARRACGRHHHRRRAAHTHGPVQAGRHHPLHSLHHHHRIHRRYCRDAAHRPA